MLKRFSKLGSRSIGVEDSLQRVLDGYRGAYENVYPRYNYLRSVAAPIIREEVEETKLQKPSIFVVTLPKSGTVFISHSLRQTLGYDYTSVMVTPTFPKNIVWPAMAADFMRGGMVSVSHMQPDTENLNALKRAGIVKGVVHMRDPRAALSSWLNFRVDYARDPGPIERLSQVGVPCSESFRNLPKADRMEHFIETFYRPCLDWITGWLSVIDTDRDFDLLLKTHDELIGQEEQYIRSVLAYYELSVDAVTLIEKNSSTHFRKGDNTSWRDDLTPGQLARVNDMLPDDLAARFGWQKD